MDDFRDLTRQVVTTLIYTLSEASGVNVDAVLRSLKKFEVSA